MTDSADVESRVRAVCDGDGIYLFELLNLTLKVVGRSCGVSSDQICDMVGAVAPESSLSAENLRRLSNDRPATFTNPLGLVVVLALLGEPEILARMARRAGFAIVPLSGEEGTVCDVLTRTAAYQGEVAETLAEIAKALPDGKMTRKQASVIIRELSEDETMRASLLRSVKASLQSIVADA